MNGIMNWFGEPLGTKPFQARNCPVKDCTIDVRGGRLNVEDYDAYFFYSQTVEQQEKRVPGKVLIGKLG